MRMRLERRVLIGIGDCLSWRRGINLAIWRRTLQWGVRCGNKLRRLLLLVPVMEQQSDQLHCLSQSHLIRQDAAARHPLRSKGSNARGGHTTACTAASVATTASVAQAAPVAPAAHVAQAVPATHAAHAPSDSPIRLTHHPHPLLPPSPAPPMASRPSPPLQVASAASARCAAARRIEVHTAAGTASSY